MASTKSVSSHNSESITEALIAFLEGQRSLIDIEFLLRDRFAIDFSHAPRKRKIQSTGSDFQVEIQVRDEHLRAMLKCYIQGSITDAELSDWAAFVFMLDFYVPEGDNEDERELNGEGLLWDLLQRLMTPQLFDGLTQEVARSYLVLLQD